MAPLHLSSMAKDYRYVQRDNHAESLGRSLLRLPLFHGMKTGQIDYVMEHVSKYYKK